MTALRAHHRGGSEQLLVERAPVPVPATGEELVAVHTAGTPVIPSHEVYGAVSEIGSTETELAPGDEICGSQSSAVPRLITPSAPPPPERTNEFRFTATFFIVVPDRDQLTATFAVERGREACESGREDSRSGKTVLVVTE